MRTLGRNLIAQKVAFYLSCDLNGLLSKTVNHCFKHNYVVRYLLNA